METKIVRSIIQDILLGLKSQLTILLVTCWIMATAFQTVYAEGTTYTQAPVNSIITFTIESNADANETVLSDMIQSGIIYFPSDSSSDEADANEGNSSGKTSNMLPIMEQKIYNHVLDKGQNKLKLQVSIRQDGNKDPEMTNKEPIYLVTSENIAGYLPENEYTKIGTATSGTSNYNVYVSSATLEAYDNSATSSIAKSAAQEMSVSAFPNPTTDYLTVNLAGLGMDHIEEVSMINLIGVKVMNIKSSQIQPSMQLNVSELPQGIYYLSVETDANQHLLKRITILN